MVNRYSKEMMQDMSKRIQNFIKKEKRCPNYVNAQTMDNRIVQVRKPIYAGLFEARNRFILNNGREPNYVTEVSSANNPLILDYQDTTYTCGPTSLSMGIQYLYGYISEQRLQKICKTIKKVGTDPINLINGAKEVGYKLSPIERSVKSVKNSISQYSPIIAHIDTIKAPCLKYTSRKNFGHYILIFDVDDNNNFKVADPIKGIKKVTGSCIVNAQYQRKINFYKLEIL